jgi:hypothetical protein
MMCAPVDFGVLFSFCIQRRKAMDKYISQDRPLLLFLGSVKAEFDLCDYICSNVGI